MYFGVFLQREVQRLIIELRTRQQYRIDSFLHILKSTESSYPKSHYYGNSPARSRKGSKQTMTATEGSQPEEQHIPSLEVFKVLLDAILTKLIYWKMSLPTSGELDWIIFKGCFQYEPLGDYNDVVVPFEGAVEHRGNLKKNFCLVVAETRRNHPKSGSQSDHLIPGVSQNRSCELISLYTK